jgi:hypothetical protein
MFTLLAKVNPVSVAGGGGRLPEDLVYPPLPGRVQRGRPGVGLGVVAEGVLWVGYPCVRGRSDRGECIKVETSKLTKPSKLIVVCKRSPITLGHN